MEAIGTIFNNVGILVAALAGGISLVMFGFAGIQYMTAQGDPQAMGRAKMSVIGAVVGLGIAGLAFVMPGIISRIIIEPAGGAGVTVNVGDDCDQLLRDQMVVQRGASTDDRMQELIRQIQVQRSNCISETWDPFVVDTDFAASVVAGAAGSGLDRCFGNITTSIVVGDAKVGGQVVPRGLGQAGNVRDLSGRDSSNNIIVYWSDVVDQRPADGSACWLYVDRLNVWSVNNN